MIAGGDSAKDMCHRLGLLQVRHRSGLLQVSLVTFIFLSLFSIDIYFVVLHIVQYIVYGVKDSQISCKREE